MGTRAKVVPFRAPALRAGVAAALAALALAAAPEAEGKVIWRVKGGGFGHGVGLSQYGAYGFAKRGKGWKAIVRHYYRGTAVRATKGRRIRVLLRPYQSRVRFTGANKACGRSLSPRTRYSATRGSGGRVILRNPGGRAIRSCGRKLVAFGGKSVVMLGKGVYRGALVVRPSSVPGRVNAINVVGVEAYVRGIVALESPSSWPLNALRAQAVVARSYGLSSSVGGRGFEHYDDTRSQVYGGVRAETRRTNRAVRDTRLQVVKYKGRIAQTFFFSTSGGWTENNENVWGGAPVPYLRGVKDPFDGASPLHRWVRKFSVARMQSRLRGLVKGRLRRVVVLKKGFSPRIVRARLVGSGGSTRVHGQTLKYRLALPDAPWNIKRIVR
jgi:stage II sporulation protein D